MPQPSFRSRTGIINRLRDVAPIAKRIACAGRMRGGEAMTSSHRLLSNDDRSYDSRVGCVEGKAASAAGFSGSSSPKARSASPNRYTSEASM